MKKPNQGVVVMLAFDHVSLVRLSEYARELRRLYAEGSDQQIDREFSGVCYAVWGYTLDDFDDEMLSADDHAWLDDLTPEMAEAFAMTCGYDLRDYAHGGMVADWWGFAWMILAEKRGILTPFMASLAWSRYDARHSNSENVISFRRR